MTTVLRNSIGPDIWWILLVSTSMPKSLNKLVYLSIRPTLFFYQTETLELSRMSWRRSLISPFLVLSAPIIWFSAQIFLTLSIAFLILVAFWIIVDASGFILCIRGQAQKTIQIARKSSVTAISLTALTTIRSYVFLLIIHCKSSMITLYSWQKMVWYCSTHLIDQ